MASLLDAFGVPTPFPLVIKFVFPWGEVRRVRLHDARSLTFPTIINMVCNACNTSQGGESGVLNVLPSHSRVMFKDDENEDVKILSNADVEDAVIVAHQQRRKVLRITITGVNKPSHTTQPRVVSPVKPPLQPAPKSHTPPLACVVDEDDDGGVEEMKTGMVVASPVVESEHVCGMVVQSPVVVVDDDGDNKQYDAPATVPDLPPVPYVARAVRLPTDSNVVRVVASRGPAVVHKTIRLRNEGDTQWPAGVRLVHVGGDLMGGPQEGVVVSRAVPGETVTVRVTFVVANKAVGTYTSEWRLSVPNTGVHTAPKRRLFGYRVWTDFEVVNGSHKCCNGNGIMLA